METLSRQLSALNKGSLPRKVDELAQVIDQAMSLGVNSGALKSTDFFDSEMLNDMNEQDRESLQLALTRGDLPFLLYNLPLGIHGRFARTLEAHPFTEWTQLANPKYIVLSKWLVNSLLNHRRFQNVSHILTVNDIAGLVSNLLFSTGHDKFARIFNISSNLVYADCAEQTNSALLSENWRYKSLVYDKLQVSPSSFALQTINSFGDTIREAFLPNCIINLQLDFLGSNSQCTNLLGSSAVEFLITDKELADSEIKKYRQISKLKLDNDLYRIFIRR